MWKHFDANFAPVFPEMRAQLEHTILSLLYKLVRIPTPTSSFRMPRASSRFSRVPRKILTSRTPLKRSGQAHFHARIPSISSSSSSSTLLRLLKFISTRLETSFDLVMRSTLSSRSRARAFLWLVWWYLESDFSQDAALHNPFGPGQVGEELMDYLESTAIRALD
jgi:hypothetical protein